MVGYSGTPLVTKLGIKAEGTVALIAAPPGWHLDLPPGGLWIAWPKRASGVETDLTDSVVRGVALPRGLVDNKVCAVDETWTGLRLVWRREHRG